MEEESDLRDAYTRLEEALKLLDRWGHHLAAAEVDSARLRVSSVLANLGESEPGRDHSRLE